MTYACDDRVERSMESSFGQLQQSHEFITVCNLDGVYAFCRWNFGCCLVVVGRHTGDIMGMPYPETGIRKRLD